MVNDLKKTIQFSEKIDHENAENLYKINNNITAKSNAALEVESSMMLEEFSNANNQGLLPEDFLKLIRLDGNIY